MFTAASFIIAQIWKQLKCSSTDKYTVVQPSMIYQSAVNNNKLLILKNKIE